MNAETNLSLLNMIEHPAFCVQNNIVIQANQPAQQLLILEGANIADIIKNDYAAYQEYQDGHLFLTITTAGIAHNAVVTRLGEFDIFTLQNTDTKLEAFALAASQLRIPFSEVMTAVNYLSTTETMQGPYVNALYKGLNQMHRMLTNMSDAARYRNGEDARLEITNLTAYFDELMEKLSLTVQLTNRTLQYAGLSVPFFAMADRIMLERAVSNLLTNAIKFSPEGSTITTALTHQGDTLRFSVLDQGQRQPDSVRKNLFNHYMRAAAPETYETGLGLGLPLVASIAVIHGGTALVDYPGEVGTRVSFTMRQNHSSTTEVRSPIRVPMCDYSGGWDVGLLEFSDVLPADAYSRIK